ncbi:MAG TPA: hypothetical protein PL124_10470 [Candidatus Cloacimonadota bacterium]|nr:hypothetical protein [Candidatus Cloacimonadota bacterium]
MKDRFDINEQGAIRDLHTGTILTNRIAVDILNAHERVLARITEVIEQREEAT